MSAPVSCPREAEVLDLVAIGQWPARADEALRAHVATCAVCADLAAVAVAMSTLNDSALASARVPDAAVVWYRAQRRARADLARRAGRPMLVAQIVAAGVLFGAGLFAWPASSAWLAAWWTGMADSAAPLDLTFRINWTATSNWIAAGVAGSVMLIVAAFGVARLVDRNTDSPTRS